MVIHIVNKRTGELRSSYDVQVVTHVGRRTLLLHRPGTPPEKIKTRRFAVQIRTNT